MSEIVFHAHPEGAHCVADCWSLDEFASGGPIRERRIDHNHVFQVEPEDLHEARLFLDCPACNEINLSHMFAKPYKTATGGYDINVRHGGWA